MKSVALLTRLLFPSRRPTWTALFILVAIGVSIFVASAVDAHPGHPEKKLFQGRWYHQVEGDNYEEWMTLSTSDIDISPTCDNAPQNCFAKWAGPFDASMADWNGQATTVSFDYSEGVADVNNNVNVLVVDEIAGDPTLLGRALTFDINHDECFDCTTYYGVVALGDDAHDLLASGAFNTFATRQSTISHELGHLIGLRHESVNNECGMDETGSIPVSIMSYDCINPVSVGGEGIFEVQPWDVCGVNHAYFDPTIGFASRTGVTAAGEEVCGEGLKPTSTPQPTSTPEPSDTPEPTTTPEPSDTPTPSATPEPAEGVQGDVDCDIDVDSVDALKDLRHVAALSVVQNEPCTDIGVSLGAQLQGDVDCDGDVDSVDALKILRSVAALSVVQNEPCTDIGLPFAPLEGEGNLEVTVVDAVSGDPLPGVSGRLHPAGAGRVQASGICAGAPFESRTTDSQGQMAFNDVAAGFYSLTIDGGEDFIAICRQNILILGDQTTQMSVGLSPVLKTGEIRIVLSWNEEPSDLDSHLWLPPADPYHVCWNNKGSSGSFPFAALDLDDVTSFGPETITIYEPQPGIYTYAVHNFRDEFGDDPPISQSNAHVDVFGESGLIRSFDAPTSGNGFWWNVFTLNAETGQITTINQIGGDPEPYPSGNFCS